MDLIANITSSLRVDPQTAKGAVGSVLGLIKQQAPADFAAVEQKVPEAGGWMAAAPQEGGGGGGLGDLLGSVGGGLLGGQAGGGLAGLGGLVGSLSKLGLGADSLGKLVPLVLQFLRSRAGDGLVGKLLSSVPALSQLGQGGPAGGGGSPLGGLGDLFK